MTLNSIERDLLTRYLANSFAAGFNLGDNFAVSFDSTSLSSLIHLPAQSYTLYSIHLGDDDHRLLRNWLHGVSAEEQADVPLRLNDIRSRMQRPPSGGLFG